MSTERTPADYEDRKADASPVKGRDPLDPLINPKLGDVVGTCSSIREVQWAGYDAGSGDAQVDYKKRGGKRTVTCWLRTWREWAKNAEVLHVG